jgi:hypothetical protein
MKKLWLVPGAVCASAVFLACLGDDSIFAQNDGGTSADASATDATSADAGHPTGVDASNVDSGSTPPPPRLLVSYNGGTETEMVAFNLTTNVADGRLAVFDYLGSSYVAGTTPFFMAQSTDQVLKLDSNQPWVAVSSWNVAGNDKSTDGGVMDSFADPNAVVVAAGNKAYVLRYTRRMIDVLDISTNVDGGAPTKQIDLSSLLDPNDSDGVVDMTAAFFHPGRNRLYVLLGNVDRNKFDPTTYALICSGLNSSLIAIDTTTDTVTTLGGTAPGGGIKLPLYNPIVGIKMAYDATNDRLLVLGGGCNANLDAGTPVNLQQREVDEVKLGANTADKVLDLNTQAYPSAFVMLDTTNAAIGTFGGTFLWNTSGSTLGATVPNAPDFFTTDGNGNLVGTQQSYFMDGGAGPVNIVRVTQDGGTTTLGSSIQTIPAPFFIGGVDVWPPPK